MKYTWCLMVLLAVMSVDFAGGGVDEADMNDTKSNQRTAAGDMFYARVKSMNDVYTPAIFRTEVRIEPNTSDWPNVKSDGAVQALNVVALVRIRGITTPLSGTINRNRPHHEVDRELQRFDEAIQFTRNLIQASDYLLLQAPETLTEKEDGVLCDVFIDLGGKRINLAEALIESGHALRGGDYNWGARLIERE